MRLVRKAFIVSAAFNCNGKCCCGAIKNYTIASIFYIHDKCSLLISALCHNGSLIISVLKSWLRIRIWQNIDSDICTIYYSLVTRVSHITPFFELSSTLLTTHAIGLYEVTKKNFSVIDSKLKCGERFSCSTLFTWEKGPK